MTDHPDEVITHEPGRCAGCGTGLSGAEVTRTERRQVIDLPEEIRALVTEHRIVSRRCWYSRSPLDVPAQHDLHQRGNHSHTAPHPPPTRLPWPDAPRPAVTSSACPATRSTPSPPNNSPRPWANSNAIIIVR